MEALGFGPPAEPEVLLGQLVKLVRDGAEVRISKRTGNIVTLADILDEVDPDVARMTFLLQGIDSPQTFDLDIVTSQSMENPVYYVQYAHARVVVDRAARGRSGRRRAGRSTRSTSRRSCTSARPSCCARSALYPDVVADAAETRAPQKVSTWVRDFARTFHGFYRDCRVITDDAELTQARLWLAEACRIGLANALGLLGVSAPDEMARLDDDDDDDDRRRSSDRELTRRSTSRCCPRRRASSADGGAADRRRRPRRPRGRVRHAALRLRRGRAPRPVPRVPRRASATASRTRARRSSAPRWRSSWPRRASTSTSRPAASCTSRCTPASRPSASCSTATTSRRPSCAPRSRPASAGSSSTRSTSSTASRLLADAGVPRPPVLVRVTPGVEAHTHEYIETGTDDSKFGFGLAERRRAARRCSASSTQRHAAVRGPALPHRLAGVPARLVRAPRSTDGRPRARRSRPTTGVDGRRAEHGRRARRALPRRRRRRRRSREYAAVAARDRSRKALAAHGVRVAPAAASIEPGRSIAAPAGITLYTVGTIKAIPGVRTYVAVDGGMSDNLRPGHLRRALRGVPARRGPARRARRS